RVPHEAVARQRLATVEPFGVVHRVVADLAGDVAGGDVDLLQQVVAGGVFEGVGRGGPEDVGAAAGRLLADIRQPRGGDLDADLDLVAGMLLLVGRLVGGGELLGKGGHHADGIGERRA